MNTLKKVWIDKHDGGMVEISLQSEHIQPKRMRVKVTERVAGKPESLHKIEIGLLSTGDLELIMETIETYLDGEGKVIE
jgi:hypothetical protein